MKFKEPIFSAFTFGQNLAKAEVNVNLASYFNVKGVKLQDKVIKLDDVHLSAGLKYLFKCAAKELVVFKDKRLKINWISKVCQERSKRFKRLKIKKIKKITKIKKIKDYQHFPVIP